jgi:hypothetical protein
VPAEQCDFIPLNADFRQLLDLLEAQLARFHRAEAPDYDLISDILYYMIHYPDLFHHPRENVIFAHLMKRDLATAQAVEDLARQHRVIAASGKRLHESLASVAAGALISRQSVEAPGLLYVTYYRLTWTRRKGNCSGAPNVCSPTTTGALSTLRSNANPIPSLVKRSRSAIGRYVDSSSSHPRDLRQHQLRGMSRPITSGVASLGQPLSSGAADERCGEHHDHRGCPPNPTQ